MTALKIHEVELIAPSQTLRRGSVHALQYGLRQTRPRYEITNTKRTTGATDGPKSLKGFSLAIALPCDAS
jgi:hypothetical protein